MEQFAKGVQSLWLAQERIQISHVYVTAPRR